MANCTAYLRSYVLRTEDCTAINLSSFRHKLGSESTEPDVDAMSHTSGPGRQRSRNGYFLSAHPHHEHLAGMGLSNRRQLTSGTLSRS